MPYSIPINGISYLKILKKILHIFLMVWIFKLESEYTFCVSKKNEPTKMWTTKIHIGVEFLPRVYALPKKYCEKGKFKKNEHPSDILTFSI